MGDAGAIEELVAAFTALGLTAPEHNKARHCFAKFIGEGCDLQQLSSLFLYWQLGNIEPRIPEGTHEIHIRPLDDWQAAMGRFRRKDLVSLQRKMKKQAQELRALEKTAAELYLTRLVKHLRTEKKFGSDRSLLRWLDLGASADHLDAYADWILPILIDACNEIGPKKPPDKTRLEKAICDYVYQATGGNHYEDIAEIFAAIDSDTTTAEALKQRHSHESN